MIPSRLDLTTPAWPLTVDGRPALLLAGELGNSAASHPETMGPLWDKLAALGLNSVLVPLSWELWEPEEGRFVPTLVDALVAGAEARGLKLGLLWFGTWKNSMSCYVPSWVKRDQGRFPRARTRDGRGLDILSPFSAEVRDADARAFAALMGHLADHDDRGTVILVQVENEIGMLPEARDHRPEADRLFAGPVPTELTGYLDCRRRDLEPELLEAWGRAGHRTEGTWTEVFGPAAEEVFQAWHYARFTDAVAAAGKAVHPLPLFVNAALNRPGQKPGEYPSAGPVPHLLDVWKAGAPSVDLLCPDYYWGDYETWCRRYNRADNPLFIPEAGRNPATPAQAFLAFGQYGALGFSPFSIDLIAGAEAEALAHAYRLLASVAPVLMARRGHSAGVLVNAEHKEAKLTLDGWGITVRHDLTLGWDPRSKEPGWAPTGGLVIALGGGEFVAAGTGIVLTFATAEPGACVGLDTVSEGVYVDGRWKESRRLNGDETHQGRHVRLPYGDWEIQRFSLYTYR